MCIFKEHRRIISLKIVSFFTRMASTDLPFPPADHPPVETLSDQSQLPTHPISNQEHTGNTNPSQVPVHMNSNWLILKLGKIALLMDFMASIPLLILLYNMSIGSFPFIFLFMSITFAFLSCHAAALLHEKFTCISNALKLLGVVFLGLACLPLIPPLYVETRFAIWLVFALLWLSIFFCFMERYINDTGETVSDHQSTGNIELVLKLGKIIFLMDLLAQSPFLVLLSIETEPLFFVFFVSTIMFSFLSFMAGSLLRAESGSEFTGLSIVILMLSVVSLGFGSLTVMPVSNVKARLTIWVSFTLLWIIIFMHFLHKYIMRIHIPSIGQALVQVDHYQGIRPTTTRG